MKDLIDDFTWKAVEHHDDGVVHEFYRRLREEKQFFSTQCSACAHVAYPPRPFCPACYGTETKWVPIGDGATLYAFTTQRTALRFVAPDVIGVVDLPGVGRIVSKINAPIEELRLGQKLSFEPFEVSDKLTVHSFTPID